MRPRLSDTLKGCQLNKIRTAGVNNSYKGPTRSEIFELVEIFRAKVVDVGPDELIVELSGRESKIEAFIERLRPYGISQLVRTGRIALVRSGQQTAKAVGNNVAAEAHS